MPTAVLNITEESWYTAKKGAGQLGSCSLLQGYAPHAVIAEAWESYGTGSLSYAWNWGDGSNGTAGAVSAHVYTEPGTYTITLTVTDSIGSDDATATITVLEAADVRYVSPSGSDSANGESPGTAWRSATKVAQMLGTVGAVPAGTRIIFADDATYDLAPGVWTAVRPVGITMARSGDGSAKPIIRRTIDPMNPSNAEKELLKVSSIDLLHFAMQGLSLDGLSADGQAFGTIFVLAGRGCAILLHECTLQNGYQLVGFQKWLEPHVSSNVVVSACTGGNPGSYIPGGPYEGKGSTLFYAKVRRWAFLDNNIEYSNNHILYAEWGQGCVVEGNTFRYPAFGRHCMRLSGGFDLAIPTKWANIRNNVFTGWIDPIQTGGVHNAPGQARHTFNPLVVAPNTTAPQSIEDVEITGNTVTGGEICLNLASVSRCHVHANVFASTSPYQSAPRIQFGDSKERRPLLDVTVENNTITSTEARAQGRGILFQILPYTGPVWEGLTRHTNIVIEGNNVTATGGTPWAFHFPADAAQQDEVTHNNTWTGVPRDVETILLGGTWNNNSSAVKRSLAEWYALTGNESGTDSEPDPITDGQERRMARVFRLVAPRRSIVRTAKSGGKII